MCGRRTARSSSIPKHYILPELRDDKTPLFEDLESTLLQQPITEQNVLDAYSTYMSGFDQLSKLQIAGSYHDIDQDSADDVLHLFGVTPEIRRRSIIARSKMRPMGRPSPIAR